VLESFLITSRETLEASLVVGIVFAYLNRTNNRNYKKTVFYGIVSGILASLLAAIAFTLIAGGFEGSAEEIFEGATMLIGAFLLTTMILWMMRQKHISKEIEGKVEKHLQRAQPLFSHVGIFLLIFIAIIREGVETVIFLNATNYAGGVSFIGGLLGVAIAIVIGYVFFMSMKKVNLKKLFNASSVLLILFAAGLVAHGIHEFEEAGVFNPIIEHVWDINPAAPLAEQGVYPALHEKGVIGSFLTGLFGYNGNPSLLEILFYTGYLVLIYFLYRRIEKSKVNAIQS